MQKRAIRLTMMCILITGTCVSISAAENRTPSPEEFREIVRQLTTSGKPLPAPPQPPKGAVEFNRAVTLHTGKKPSPSDYREAARLYRIALDAGIPQAGTNLALLHLEGKGVKKDVKMGLALLQTASKQNDSQADVVLARLYLTGTDVPKDEKKGEALLVKAEKNGNKNATVILTEYREWKKKNQQAMKQYQELLKQAQATKAPQGDAASRPFQILPNASAPSPPETIPFPVIPGYPYLSGVPKAPPRFAASPPQPKVQLPASTRQNTPPVFPGSIVSSGAVSPPAPTAPTPSAPSAPSALKAPQLNLPKQSPP